MLKITSKEYREGVLAVQETVITLFKAPIFKHKKTTTNNSIVEQLTHIKERTKIKGFKHETEN